MRKMSQPQLTRFLETSDPKQQTERLAQIGVTPIVNTETAKLIVYDTAIEKAMSVSAKQRPFTMNLDAFNG